MDINKTENKQLLIVFPTEMIKGIENYQFENRIKNRSEAIRRLVKIGLEKVEARD